MIRAADVREWREHDVVDPKGRKIGVLESVYVDTATDEPAMATVRTGLPTRHRLVFVPLDEVVLGPDYVRVSRTKGTVRKAPSIGDGRRTAGRAGGDDLPLLRHGVPPGRPWRTSTRAPLITRR